MYRQGEPTNHRCPLTVSFTVFWIIFKPSLRSFLSIKRKLGTGSVLKKKKKSKTDIQLITLVYVHTPTQISVSQVITAFSLHKNAATANRSICKSTTPRLSPSSWPTKQVWAQKQDKGALKTYCSTVGGCARRNCRGSVLSLQISAVSSISSSVLRSLFSYASPFGAMA